MVLTSEGQDPLQKHLGQGGPTKGGGIWGNTENRAKSFKLQSLSDSSIPNIHLKGQKRQEMSSSFWIALISNVRTEEELQHYAIV